LQVIKYDICGQICPSTLLTALKEINNYSQQLMDGEITLVFYTDNRDAVTTIPESAANMGYTVNVTKMEKCYMLEISGGRK
jgi:TusA-related sulfurtransferase